MSRFFINKSLFENTKGVGRSCK